MKTFVKEMGEKVVNWNYILDRKIKGYKVNYKDYELEDLAGDWVTCACGNQCSIIPRSYDNEPMDKELSSLGLDFSYNIQDKDWKEAKKTLIKIEKRSTKLINQIVREKQKEIKQLEKELAQKQKEIKKILS